MAQTLGNPLRVYVDLEYCYPGMSKDTGRPSEKDLRQVVQIAAIIWNTETGTEEQSFDMLTHPAFEKQVPLFFTTLTGISQTTIDEKAVPFIEALQAFVRFCGDYPVWTFNADWGVLKQNCTYFNTSFPFEEREFIRVKPLLSAWGIDPEQYSSGTLHRAVGISMDGHVHNALHDVRSMASAVQLLEAENKNL